MSIEARLKKKFKGFSLDMDFRTQGEMMGILGASGSGKSMTLQCIAGIVTPDEGYLEVNGRVLFDSKSKVNVKPQKRRVGYLFQNYALFPHMTILQNIACIVPGGKKQREEQAMALMERFEIGELAWRYPSQLSGGQQQRAALVRILAYEPEVLLLDEPFSALDEYLREKMQVEMMELLHKEFAGDTIMVTHNRNEVFRMCDGLMVIEDGCALAIGGTKALFRNPDRLQVARLTGCKNISRAKKNGEYSVYAEDWQVDLDVGQKVPNGLTHIGVRAHDFCPAEKAGRNTMRFQWKNSMENPFEWSVVFENADATGPKQEIWWMYSKALRSGEMPEYLSVAPADVLLLRE